MSARRFPEFYSPERETTLKGKKLCAGERNWNVAPLMGDASGAYVYWATLEERLEYAGRLFHVSFIQFSSGIRRRDSLYIQFRDLQWPARPLIAL